MFNSNSASIQLREQKGYAQLINTVDREIIQRHPQTIGQLGGTTLKVGSTIVGGAVGGGAAYLAIGFFAAGPVAWGAAGIIGASTAVGAGISYYFSNSYVEKYRANAESISNFMQDLVNKTNKIQLKWCQTGKRPADLIDSLIQNLIKNKYLEHCNRLNFEFNKEKFNEIGKWYSENDRDRVTYGAKFLIIMSVATLPSKVCPTDRLIENLAETISHLSERVLENAGNFTLARLYLNRLDGVKEARRLFELIPTSSDLYVIARQMIREIEQLHPEALK